MAITIMVVTMIIQRSETDIAKKATGNLLIYGRRKVGKTFLVKNFLSPDIYALIKRGGGFYLEGAPFTTLDSYDQFIDLLRGWCEEGKVVAIDEAQRLPGDFLDIFQTLPRNGRVILTGSSFHIIKDIISPRSPILGLVSDLRLSLLDPLDILSGLETRCEDIEAMELSPYLRDPWIIPYYKKGETQLPDILRLSKGAIRSLIGEVFLEEEKTLSRVYEGIIRALSLRKWKMKEIADLLYSRKILATPDAHLVRPYFNNMEEMNIVKRIPIHGKKEYMYCLESPFMELGFMLDEKYDFFQQNISRATLKKEVKNAQNRHIERFCGELIAQAYDGKFEYFYSRDFDIDFIITKGKRVVASGEVKWKGSVTQKEISLFKERTEQFVDLPAFLGGSQFIVDLLGLVEEGYAFFLCFGDDRQVLLGVPDLPLEPQFPGHVQALLEVFPGLDGVALGLVDLADVVAQLGDRVGEPICDADLHGLGVGFQ